MTTKYLAWKDANCNGNNIEWLELTGREFYALIKSPAGKGRYFIRLYDDIGFECNEIYIEATLSGYRNWRVDENAHNYLKRINKDYETFSLDAPIDSEENTLHDLVGCDQPSVEDDVLGKIEMERINFASVIRGPATKKAGRLDSYGAVSKPPPDDSLLPGTGQIGSATYQN